MSDQIKTVIPTNVRVGEFKDGQYGPSALTWITIEGKDYSGFIKKAEDAPKANESVILLFTQNGQYWNWKYPKKEDKKFLELVSQIEGLEKRVEQLELKNQIP